MGSGYWITWAGERLRNGIEAARAEGSAQSPPGDSS
jgi:hypothetical protein